MTKRKSHAHRVPEPGAVKCECGSKFPDDYAWREHYERETSDAEQRKAEGRPSKAEEREIAKSLAGILEAPE
jgi:hypothetical protein